jgi:hypothetical protein
LIPRLSLPAVGEERAVMARLFDTTVADYTMGSPTFGKPVGNVLVGGGTRARSDDLELDKAAAAPSSTPKASTANAAAGDAFDDVSSIPEKFFDQKKNVRKSTWKSADKKKR